MRHSKNRRGVLAFLAAGITVAFLVGLAFSVGWAVNAAPAPVLTPQPAVTVLTTTAVSTKPVPTTVVKSVQVPVTVTENDVVTQTVPVVSQHCKNALLEGDGIRTKLLQVAQDMGNAAADMNYSGANAASNAEIEAASALLKQINDTDLPQYGADAIKCQGGE